MINLCLISIEIDVWHRMLMALSNQLIVNHTSASSACIIIIYHLAKIESRYGQKKTISGAPSWAWVCANVERICMKIMAHLTKLLWSHHRSDTFRCLIGFRWLPKLRRVLRHETRRTLMWRGRKDGMNARSFESESNTFRCMGDECCGNIFSMNLWLLIKVEWNVACSGTRAAPIRNYACRMCCEMCETMNDDMWEWHDFVLCVLGSDRKFNLFAFMERAHSPPARSNRCVSDFCSATFTYSAMVPPPPMMIDDVKIEHVEYGKSSLRCFPIVSFIFKHLIQSLAFQFSSHSNGERADVCCDFSCL